MGSIANLSSSFLQSILGNGLQGVSSGANSTTQAGLSALNQQSDSQQLSPFAQLMSTLQQLQQSNPTEYAQVTKQIATNLQSAAQTATTGGDTAAATQLNQLANDFTAASTSGQLPNIQDLAQAVGGGGHHHGHHHHSEAASTTGSAGTSGTSATSTPTSSTAASSTAGQSLSQLIALFQNSAANAASGAQNGSLNPLSIILNTLSSAGITSANGSN